VVFGHPDTRHGLTPFNFAGNPFNFASLAAPFRLLDESGQNVQVPGTRWHRRDLPHSRPRHLPSRTRHTRETASPGTTGSPCSILLRPEQRQNMQSYSTSNLVAILSAALGRDAPVQFVKLCGGKRIEVPCTATENFAALVGQDIAPVLVLNFGGTRVDVPSWGALNRSVRTLALNEDVITSTLTANEIAFKHGVSSSWVRKLRGQIKEPSINPKPKSEKGRAP